MRSRLYVLVLVFWAITLPSARLEGAQVVDTLTVGLSDPLGDMAWDGSTLWTCERSSPIVRRDPNTGHIVQSIRLNLPQVVDFGLEWLGQNLWVAAADGWADLYRLDPLDGSILGSLRLLNDPSGGGDILAMARKDDELWLLLGSGRESYIARVDPSTGEVSDAMLRREPSLFGLAWDGSTFVTCSYSDHMIYRFEAQSGRTLAQFPAPSVEGSSPMGLGWDGRYLWVASYPQLYRLDLDAQPVEPLRIALIQRGPRYAGCGKDMDWDEGHLWYTEVFDQGLYLIDAGIPFGVIRQLTMEYPPTGVKRVGAALWTTYNYCFGGNIIEHDVDSGEIRRVFPFRQSRSPLGLDFDGQDLRVVGAGSNADSIYRVSTLDGSILDGIAAPGPAAAGVAWDGTALWHTDLSTDLLYELDSGSGEVLSKYELPVGWAHGIAYDPLHRSFWLTDNADRIYEVLPPLGDAHLLEFTATAVDSGIVVRWKPTRSSRQDGFVLERSEQAHGSYHEIARMDGVGGSFEVLDRNPLTGRIYYYRLQAMGASGAKVLGPVSIGFHFTYPPVPTPVEVSDLRASLLPAGIRLEWSVPAEAVHELAGIDVERAPADRGPFAKITGDLLQPEPRMFYDDLGVVPGTPVWYRLALQATDGTISLAGPVGASLPGGPRGMRLDPPITTQNGVEIRFAISGSPIRVHLAIYDGRGRCIQVLENTLRGSGEHRLVWDLHDQVGRAVARGVYFVRLQAGGRTAVRKLALLRHGSG